MGRLGLGTIIRGSKARIVKRGGDNVQGSSGDCKNQKLGSMKDQIAEMIGSSSVREERVGQKWLNPWDT